MLRWGTEYSKLSGTMKISEKSRGKGRLSAMLARAKQLGSGFSPGLFRLFSPDAKHPAWRPFPTIRHCRARTSDKRRSLRSVPHWAFSRLFPPPAEAGYGPAVPESDMSAETFDVRPLRNSGNQVFSPHQVNSAIVGPGYSVPWWGAGQSPAVSHLDKSQFVTLYKKPTAHFQGCGFCMQLSLTPIR